MSAIWVHDRRASSGGGEVKAGHSVGLIDPPKVIRQTIMRATTDSGSEVRFEEAGPGVLNLLTLFQILSGHTREQIETEFDGKGYGYLKRTVADQVIASMEPIQHRFHELMGDPGGLEKMLDAGAQRARAIAEPMLDRVKELTGLG
jgi:tryptophanyl-tRNA synthetase